MYVTCHGKKMDQREPAYDVGAKGQRGAQNGFEKGRAC